MNVVPELANIRMHWLILLIEDLSLMRDFITLCNSPLENISLLSYEEHPNIGISFYEDIFKYPWMALSLCRSYKVWEALEFTVKGCVSSHFLELFPFYHPNISKPRINVSIPQSRPMAGKCWLTTCSSLPKSATFIIDNEYYVVFLKIKGLLDSSLQNEYPSWKKQALTMCFLQVKTAVSEEK